MIHAANTAANTKWRVVYGYETEKTSFALTALPAAILLAAIGNATADAVHGYVLAGTTTNSKDGAQACFGLEGISKYRLGNEFDFYSEVSYTQELAKTTNGVSFAGTVMGNTYRHYSDCIARFPKWQSTSIFGSI